MSKQETMKRSVLNKLINKTGIILLVLFASFIQLAQAQNEEVRESQSVSISTSQDGKVTLKVIQKKGNDETTFEKTYDSYEELQSDTDLEKYGINSKSFQFGSNGGRPQFFMHNGPGNGFWDNEDFGFSRFHDMEERMKQMIEEFSNGSFAFDFGNNNFMDLDSMMQWFSFKNNNGQFSFNGRKIENLDSLKEALGKQFGNFTFDFDNWGEENGSSNAWAFRNNEEDVKVITRVKAMVRTASEEDKKTIGTDTMDSMELKDISFYPNPSDGRFDVELESVADSPVQVIIVDEKGNEVFNKVGKPLKGQYKFNVDLTGEGKGIYIMKLVQNDKALTKRVVIE